MISLIHSILVWILANLNLINYFYKEGVNCFIGIKSLQFTIWRRTLKFRGDPVKLIRIRKKLRDIIS